MDNKLLLASLVGGAVGGFTSLGLYCVWNHGGKKASANEIKVQRYNTTNPRSSAIVVHSNKVYLSGQVAIIEQLETSDITEQTKQTLEKIDKLLAQVGITKSNILEAKIWLKNMSTDFAAMNEVWNAWVDPNSKGTRFCVGAALARPTLLVEIQVTAAI